MKIINFTPSRQGQCVSQNNISNKKQHISWHEFRLYKSKISTSKSAKIQKIHQTSRHQNSKKSTITYFLPRPLERGRLNSSATPRLCWKCLIDVAAYHISEYCSISAWVRPFTGSLILLFRVVIDWGWPLLSHMCLVIFSGIHMQPSSQLMVHHPMAYPMTSLSHCIGRTVYLLNKIFQSTIASSNLQFASHTSDPRSIAMNTWYQ